MTKDHIWTLFILTGAALCASPYLLAGFRRLLEWLSDRRQQAKDDRAKALRELADLKRWAIQPEDEE